MYVALHLRWLTTEKFQRYETVKGGCIPSKNKFEPQKNNKLRWLASDINFKLLDTGYPFAHGPRNRLRIVSSPVSYATKEAGSSDIFYTFLYKGLTVGASFSAVDIQKFDKVVQKV